MRTPSRSVVVGAATWVGVVAVVAALVWVVITRAGAGVSDESSLGDTGAPAPIGTTTSSRAPSSTPTRTPPPSAAAEPVQRSASGVGGTVTVRCTGGAADLVAATPSGGYAAEVKDGGPDRIRVEFETDRAGTEIEATCPNGSPSFSVEEDD